MWAMLRVVLFEWILARLGLRWLIGLLVAVPLALFFFVGIPTLLIAGVVIFLLWRLISSAMRAPSPATHHSEPE
jgi:hypothetical protein